MYNFKYVTTFSLKPENKPKNVEYFAIYIVKVFRYFNIAYRYKYSKKIIYFEEVLCAKN